MDTTIEASLTTAGFHPFSTHEMFSVMIASPTPDVAGKKTRVILLIEDGKQRVKVDDELLEGTFTDPAAALGGAIAFVEKAAGVKIAFVTRNVLTTWSAQTVPPPPP